MNIHEIFTSTIEAFKKPVEKPTPNGELPKDVLLSFADTQADKLKDFLIEAASMVVPILIVVSLISSNGYFFSGFQTFTFSNFNVVFQWTVGAAIELGTAGLLFSSSRSLKKKNPGWWKPLIAVSLLMTISVVAQYMYLRAEWEMGSLNIPTQAVSNIPIFGGLVGLGGMDAHGVFFLLRSLAMHLTEVTTTFLMVPLGTSLEKLLERQRKKHEYSTAQANQEMALGLQKSIQDVIMAVMAEQQLLIQQRGKALMNGTIVSEIKPEVAPDFPKALVDRTKPTQQSDYQAEISERATGPLPTIKI